MAATTVSRVGKLVRSEPRGFKIKASLENGSAYTGGILPGGTLVGIKADGYAEPVAANTAYTLVGFNRDEYDTSGDTADGSTTIELEFGVIAKLVCAGAAIANVGDRVFPSDNQTVVFTDPVDATPAIGHVVEVESATAVWCYIAPLIINP